LIVGSWLLGGAGVGLVVLGFSMLPPGGIKSILPLEPPPPKNKTIRPGQLVQF